jgi:hypothetical protein
MYLCCIPQEDLACPVLIEIHQEGGLPCCGAEEYRSRMQKNTTISEIVYLELFSGVFTLHGSSLNLVEFDS